MRHRQRRHDPPATGDGAAHSGRRGDAHARRAPTAHARSSERAAATGRARPLPHARADSERQSSSAAAAAAARAMTGNGADAYAALAARVAELESAVRILAQRWEEQLGPRLVAIERDVDQVAAQVAELLDK